MSLIYDGAITELHEHVSGTHITGASIRLLGYIKTIICFVCWFFYFFKPLVLP